MRNPAILTARQEIRRTKGVQIEVLSQALPHLDATAAFNYTDPHLRGSGSSFFQQHQHDVAVSAA